MYLAAQVKHEKGATTQRLKGAEAEVKIPSLEGLGVGYNIKLLIP
jgi:hypothetical protein